MRLPTRRQALFAITGLAVVISLLLLWPSTSEGKRIERHETQPTNITFDFAGPNETKTTEVSLTLTKQQLESMEEVQVFVLLNVSILQRYPETASGSVECWTTVFINDKQWIRPHHSTQVSAGPPDEWGEDNLSAVHRQTVQLTYPRYLHESYVKDQLDQSRDNVIRATATCTSHVSSTGPTSAVVKLGPLTALITS